MATMTVARCPKCHIEVGSTWRWCLACGYDPDGSAQRVRQAAIEARRREGGWLPVIIVLVGLLVGGAILWRTTPDDTPLPTESPSTAAEAPSWIPFTPPSGGVRVDFPAPPVSSPVAQPSRSGRMIDNYAIGAGDHLYTVSVIDTGRPELVAGDSAAVEQAMRGYVEGIAAEVSGQVSSAEMHLGGPAPMLDFEISDAVIGRMRGRVMILGAGPNAPAGRLASAAVTSKQLSDDFANHVIDSFVVE